MRRVCISDTHSLHEEMPQSPGGDLLIHTGDCTGSGSSAALDDFTRWFGALPHKHRILIAGNHDYCFEKHPKSSSETCIKHGITYLRRETTRIGSLNFYGFPWQPIDRWMAFNAGEGELRGRLKRAPDDTNILISHGPAFNIFDYVPSEQAHVGCHALANRIEKLKELRAHVCGHIHESYGFAVRKSDGVKFANASTCTDRYRPSNLQIVIDL
jgi:3',5'-cyclic AMP phosphodiesterase CpdA